MILKYFTKEFLCYVNSACVVLILLYFGQRARVSLAKRCSFNIVPCMKGVLIMAVKVKFIRPQELRNYKQAVKFSSPQELLTYINNPANYKQTQKKIYQIWCCMPPVGTHVHNKLENIDYTTDNNARFVLSGTRGEQWVITVGELAQRYTFANGTLITPDTLKRRQSVDGSIDWFMIQTRPTVQKVWACFVPAAYEFSYQSLWGTMVGNRKGIPHGLGDFIVRSDVFGMPGKDGYVCNGAIFADTYDNRGFSDYLDHRNSARIDLPKPASLWCKGDGK